MLCLVNPLFAVAFSYALNYTRRLSAGTIQQVAGSKLALLASSSNEIITGKSVDQMKDEFLYNSLVSCYAMFYNSYRNQGNRISANESYIEWKDIETIYLKHFRSRCWSFSPTTCFYAAHRFFGIYGNV